MDQVQVRNAISRAGTKGLIEAVAADVYRRKCVKGLGL